MHALSVVCSLPPALSLHRCEMQAGGWHTRRRAGAASSAPITREPRVLPGKGDEEGWRALSAPYAGRLRLLPTAGFRHCVKQPTKRCLRRGGEDLAEVDLWLQNSLHFVLVAPGQAAAAAPRPGEHLPTSTDDHPGGFHFVPLRRGGAGRGPHFDVRVHSKAKHSATAGGDPWVVEVRCPPSKTAVTFLAPSEKEAREWERQLSMRAAPLTVVWSEVFGISGTSGPGRGGPSTHLSRSRNSRLLDKLEARLSTDLITGAAGVVTAVAHEAAFNLTVAAGPLVGYAMGMLWSAARVCGAFCRTRHTADKL